MVVDWTFNFAVVLNTFCWHLTSLSCLSPTTLCKNGTITYCEWAWVGSTPAMRGLHCKYTKLKKKTLVIKLIGSLLGLGFGVFLWWFWQFHVGGSISIEVHHSGFTVALWVMRLKHEPWKSIKSSNCWRWQVVFFLFNLVKSLAALISTFKSQHSKTIFHLLVRYTLLYYIELQLISSVTATVMSL